MRTYNYIKVKLRHVHFYWQDTFQDRLKDIVSTGQSTAESQLKIIKQASIYRNDVPLPPVQLWIPTQFVHHVNLGPSSRTKLEQTFYGKTSQSLGLVPCFIAVIPPRERYICASGCFRKGVIFYFRRGSIFLQWPLDRVFI